jgi:adenylosuccinate synthase
LIHPDTTGVIGNGVVINPAVLLDEIYALISAGIDINPKRLKISYASHLITPAHLAIDRAREIQRGKNKIGTTLRGIGPAYADRVSRVGIRAEAMLSPETFADSISNQIKAINQQMNTLYKIPPLDSHAIGKDYYQYAVELKPYITDVSTLLTNELRNGKRILAEGAQGTLLDLDHGSYPFVTSSNPTAAGALIGLGLGVGCVGRVIGVTKAFQSRVGEGPFPSEINGDIAKYLRGSGDNPWDEYGTTTGRPRRIGWLDSVLLRYAIRINGCTELAITKLDILSGLDIIKLCSSYQCNTNLYDDLPTSPANLDRYEPIFDELPGWKRAINDVRTWEDLPPQARAYILRIEELTNLPVTLISVGPERNQLVDLR